MAMNAQTTTYSPKLIETLKHCGHLTVDAPLSDFTTFQTGGPADILVEPRDCASVKKVIQLAREEGLQLTVMGGSNLLVGDKGIRGIVLCFSEKSPGCTRIVINEEGLIYADASVSKERFIRFALDNSFEGVQFMTGIPGSIGGGIKMNAGTFMGCFIDILKRVAVIDRNGDMKEVDVNLEMSDYREMNLGEYVAITGGYFKLPEANDSEKAKNEVEEILADRETKHPLDFPSAGSVFKNPPGHSSWELVDRAGLKGCRVGGARVSEKHTNFVINYEKATSQDIRSLIELIQETVYRKFRIKLETEIKMIGEF